MVDKFNNKRDDRQSTRPVKPSSQADETIVKPEKKKRQVNYEINSDIYADAFILAGLYCIAFCMGVFSIFMAIIMVFYEDTVNWWYGEMSLRSVFKMLWGISLISTFVGVVMRKSRIKLGYGKVNPPDVFKHKLKWALIFNAIGAAMMVIGVTAIQLIFDGAEWKNWLGLFILFMIPAAFKSFRENR